MRWLSWLNVLQMMAGLCSARPLNQGRTLVITEDKANSAKYQSFLNRLENEGYKLEVRNVRDESIELIQFDELEYDNLVVFPTKVKALGPKLTAKRLLQYFNKGGNVLAVTNPDSVPESIREFACELGINISPKGYKLIDHFVGKGDKHDEIVVNDESRFPTPHVAKAQSLKYSGGGAYLGNGEMLLPIVTAPRTSFVYDTRDDSPVVSTPWVSGTQTALVAGLQGRNNARFLWSGSDNMFIESDTADLVDGLAKWVFYERGVVKSTFVEHHLKDSKVLNEKLYKVSENLTYSVGLAEWDGEKFKGYEADDIQLEFVMLDPYYRLTLERDDTRSNDSQTVYTRTFKIPDQYGMFTFRLNYERPGLSNVRETQVVTIRHIANDEWPRSWQITNSWVYLTSAVSVVAAWLVFVVLYLYSGEDKKKVE